MNLFNFKKNQTLSTGIKSLATLFRPPTNVPNIQSDNLDDDNGLTMDESGSDDSFVKVSNNTIERFEVKFIPCLNGLLSVL